MYRHDLTNVAVDVVTETLAAAASGIIQVVNGRNIKAELELLVELYLCRQEMRRQGYTPKGDGFDVTDIQEGL